MHKGCPECGKIGTCQLVGVPIDKDPLREETKDAI